MSRFWNDNPELLDEKTTEFLPTCWKEKIEKGEIELSAVPEEIREKAMEEGIADFWANQIDGVVSKLKEARCQR